MKSIVLIEPGKLVLQEISLPPAPGENEVQVRVRQVGICGTDLHAFQGHQPFFTYPRILGHELAVEVVEIGPTPLAHNFKVGDHGCIQPYLNCGHCGACLRGFDNCCMNLQVIGVHRDGGMRELINVPIDKLHKAPLKDDELALVEMLSIGAHAVRRAHVIPGEFALVVGVGPIGLGAALFAQQAGARVIVADVSEWRLGFAQQHLGIEYRIDAKDAPLEQLRAIIPNDMPSVVFDATGNSKSMHQSFQYTAHGGRLVFVGLFTGDITFNDPEFHRRELSLLASRNATALDFQTVLHLLETGRVDVTSWISRRASPEETVVEFADWIKPESHIIKAMLTF